MKDVPHAGYPERLGYGGEDVVAGVVLGATVIGMAVTIVEPCALVVVRLANEVVGAPVLALLAEASAAELDGNGAVASDGVAGPRAAEGAAVRGRRKRRRRVWRRFMAWEESKRNVRGPLAHWRVVSGARPPSSVDRRGVKRPRPLELDNTTGPV